MGKRSNKTEFIEKANRVHNKLYNYRNVTYELAKIKIEILCNKHGSFLQTPNDHLTGYGCPTCSFEKTAKEKRSTKEVFVTKANKKHNNTYDYSQVVYKNAITKVIIICSVHGKFFQTPDKHLGGTACPKCSIGISRGEKEIMKQLDIIGINYEREKTFPDLRGTTKNSRLRYDFWIPSHNLLIEYDGEQHFKPINIKGRLTESEIITKHERTVINDIKKNEYAQKNKIHLLRIPFSSNISDELFKFFSL